MSGSGPVNERTVREVLLALWRGGAAVGGEVSMQRLLRETLAPLPDVQYALEQLVARGCRVEKVPGAAAGVRLVSTGLACWGEILQEESRRRAKVGAGRIGRRVVAFGRTTSTNDMAWQCAGEENDGTVVVADEQTAGRGRLGHGWAAKGGQSVLMSVLLLGVKGSIDSLTLLAGLAAAEGVEKAVKAAGGAVVVDLKWPNDLLVGGKKLGGILVERRGEAVVIGIGINVMQGQGDWPGELEGRAISIYQAAEVLMDRLRVVAAVAEALDGRLGEVEGGGWIEEWKRRCPMLGQRIGLRVDNRVVRGQVLDVDPLNGLVVRDDGGGTQFVSAQRATVEEA